MITFPVTVISVRLKMFCECIKLFKFYMLKMFLWFLKKIFRLTVCQLFWSVLIVAVTLLVLFWSPNKNTAEVSSSNPVILWWTDTFPGSSYKVNCPNNMKCDVYSERNMTSYFDIQAYLFYGSSIKFDDLPLPRRPKDIIWGLYHEESPRNTEEFMHEPVLNLFNFSSTYSRFSNVPFPLQYLDSFADINSVKYFVETSVKNSLLQEIAPILYLQSDCDTSTERDLYVKELMKLVHVDSYGSCLNNKKLEENFTHDYLNNLNEDEFLKFVARYKFVVAIENGVCDDYVTEKFWRAIKVGSVPIYLGSPSIRDWFPNTKSAILLEDYPTPEILNNHLNKLLKNDDLYEEYLEHKIKGTISNNRLIEEYQERSYQLDSLKTVQKFECFVCQKVHDKINGRSVLSIVNKSHYNCPKPLSALQLTVNPVNSWVHSWEYTREKANEIYKNVMNDV